MYVLVLVLLAFCSFVGIGVFASSRLGVARPVSIGDVRVVLFSVLSCIAPAAVTGSPCVVHVVLVIIWFFGCLLLVSCCVPVSATYSCGRPESCTLLLRIGIRSFYAPNSPFFLPAPQSELRKPPTCEESLATFLDFV